MDITLHHIAKSYGRTPALHPLDLHIRSGAFTTLLGPSGCGKTTLLRLIAGLETPDSGKMQFGDEVVYDFSQSINKPVHKRGLGMVFQDFALWPHMTVFENVAFGLRAKKHTKELQQRVSEAIQAVRLRGFEQRYPHQLSGGQQQRVAFARAIAVRPQVILFDEPLSALDATLREEMRGELTAMVRDFGLTAVYVTHDQEEAMTMSDQVVVMRQGRIQQVGTPQEIYERPATAEVAGFIGKSNWLQGSGMIRPEKLSWLPRAGADAYSGTIRNVAYTGERYEFELAMSDGGTWTAYHQQHQEKGATCLFYVNPQDIHYVQIEEEVKR